MRTMCSQEIFMKNCRQQQIFDSDLKGAWHYNHVTFTLIAKNFMLYCRLIYMLSILCVRLTIKVKVGIPESFKVGYSTPPQKKTGSSHLQPPKIKNYTPRQNRKRVTYHESVNTWWPPSWIWAFQISGPPQLFHVSLTIVYTCQDHVLGSLILDSKYSKMALKFVKQKSHWLHSSIKFANPDRNSRGWWQKVWQASPGMEIPGDGGSKTKVLCMGVIWIFSGTAH